MRKEKLFSIKMRASSGGRHISGAEGIYSAGNAGKIITRYYDRAMLHPRGRPDEVTLKIRVLRRKPVMLPLLDISTLRVSSVSSAVKSVRKLLSVLDISPKAAEKAVGLLCSGKTMRGAAVICAGNARRIEPDRTRGLRATELGITARAETALSRGLKVHGTDNPTVKEAVVLASKMISCPGVVAELCISDDPDYTTGYVASARWGYVRIPKIKKKGSAWGGRAVFVHDAADPELLAAFLEQTPVMINRISSISGEVDINELIGDSSR